MFFFFFQAEDGIRDVAVTGVQTCALPICCASRRPPLSRIPAPDGRTFHVSARHWRDPDYRTAHLPIRRLDRAPTPGPPRSVAAHPPTAQPAGDSCVPPGRPLTIPLRPASAPAGVTNRQSTAAS